MSKKFGIWVVTWPLSATMAWCKKIISQCFRSSEQPDSGRANCLDNSADALLAATASYPLRIDFGENCMELNELIAVLRVGDRIRLFCDDGLLVAEKVSQTQLKVIHFQTMPALIQ